MKELFELSKKIMEAAGGSLFKKTEPHDDPLDWESPDLLWNETTPENETSHGEYFAISKATENGEMWCVMHNASFTTGGDPTIWSCFGDEGSVLKAVIEYLNHHLD